MTVLAIHGSPRPDGISSTILDLVLAPLRERRVPVTAVRVYDLNITPCTACGYCRENPRCVFQDGMVDQYDFLRRADAVIIASPLYFSSLPGQLKLYIDRCQVIWEEARREKADGPWRPGFAVLAAGGRYSGMFTPAVTVIRHFYNVLRCRSDEKDYILVDDTDTISSIPGHAGERARAAGEQLYQQLAGTGHEDHHRHHR